MSRLDEARTILKELHVPAAQRTDMCCYVFLAIAGMTQKGKWQKASQEWMRIHDIIVFIKEHYSVEYAENSRETIRKQAIHHFRNAAFIEDNGAVTNSPNYQYRLTDEMLSLVRSFGTPQWSANAAEFLAAHKNLVELYEAKREFQKVPVIVNGNELTFSSGKHNALQKAIIEEFAPRFVPNAKCLYVGDTAEKDLFKDEETLNSLGVVLTVHDKMPDVILYSEAKQTLFFIEAVTSVGPMTSKRLLEISAMTEKAYVRKIYVSAFPDFGTYKKFSAELAWETEVWIADTPDHMIHLNGDKFL